MHRLDLMLPILMRLNLHYPQTGRTVAQLQVLAQDWCDDLAAYSIEEVVQAATAHRRESLFFPCVSEIITRCRGARILQKNRMNTIPERKEEQVEIDWEFQRRMLQGLRNKLNQWGGDTKNRTKTGTEAALLSSAQ